MLLTLNLEPKWNTIKLFASRLPHPHLIASRWWWSLIKIGPSACFHLEWKTRIRTPCHSSNWIDGLVTGWWWSFRMIRQNRFRRFNWISLLNNKPKRRWEYVMANCQTNSGGWVSGWMSVCLQVWLEMWSNNIVPQVKLLTRRGESHYISIWRCAASSLLSEWIANNIQIISRGGGTTFGQRDPSYWKSYLLKLF